ncbi:acyl-CoA N-acyltransferase [Dacryopinax primogenitus]|uniref:Glucosamine 6-phosphate N-acetyltransferase n=1 Tax=Dacryopinax primogenitus (strain DJM 731) TaxID=1858805 RepID=M5G754_DACPD|nr:acyl-CoA N-acyltransferase [Dacryopinax primogenitus]EJT99592.1 acyl-CoA N-acyltransferase [Dacryopinax primogenitus]
MSTPLFPAHLLPPPPPSLAADLLIRSLERDDHLHGHMQVLNVLSPTPDITPDAYHAIFDDMARRPETYYTIVILSVPTSQILATSTLLLERKHLRSGGLVGHIEDVAVSSLAQGRGLGKLLITTLTGLAEGLGCYKVILDCARDNVGFYEKCGFWEKEVEMVQYFGAAKAGKQPPPRVKDEEKPNL